MEPNVQNIGEFLARGGSTAARLIAAGMDVSVLRPYQEMGVNALLREDEWKDLDEAVVRVARQRLGVIEFLRGRNLVRPLGGLGVMLAEFEKLSDMTPAEQSMAAVTPPEEDTVDYTLTSVPVPITHKGFRVNARRLAASRNRGEPIDVTSAELAGMVVAEKLEDTVINGSAVVVGGNTAYGLTNHPNRNTGNFAADWNTATGAQILTDVLAMIAALEADNYYGPYVLLVGTSYNAELRDDLKAQSDKTIRDRLLEIDALDAILVSSKLAVDNAVLFQPTSNVIQLAVGQDITTVEWDDMGGLEQKFLVLSALAPLVKVDHESQSGICHYTTS